MKGALSRYRETMSTQVELEMISASSLIGFFESCFIHGLDPLEIDLAKRLASMIYQDLKLPEEGNLPESPHEHIQPYFAAFLIPPLHALGVDSDPVIITIDAHLTSMIMLPKDFTDWREIMADISVLKTFYAYDSKHLSYLYRIGCLSRMEVPKEAYEVDEARRWLVQRYRPKKHSNGRRVKVKTVSYYAVEEWLPQLHDDWRCHEILLPQDSEEFMKGLILASIADLC
jgi:hypothetical protein